MSVSSGRESPGSVALGAFGLGLVGLFVGLLFGLVGLLLLEASFAPQPDSPAPNAVSTTAQGVGLVAVGVFYLKDRDLPWSYLRIEWPSLRDVAWIVATPIALLVAFVALLAVVQQFGLVPTQHSIQRAAEQNPQLLLPLIPLSILVTGPAEEFLYRGIIQTRLKETFDTVSAVAVAAVIFALAHIPAYGLGVGFNPELATTIAMLAVLGVILGAVYEHTGNLVVPAVAHGLYNAVAFGNQYIDIVAGLL